MVNTAFFRNSLFLCLICPITTVQAEEITLYVGAGLKKSVDCVINQFETKTNNKVIAEYGGSGQILARYKLTQAADLLLSGSADNIEQLKTLNKVSHTYPIVRHVPALVIRRDIAEKNNIKTVQQLAESQLKLGIGDAKSITLGAEAERMLANSQYNESLQKLITVRTPTMKQLLVYLDNGNIDAAVIGKAEATRNSNKYLILDMPSDHAEDIVTLAVLNTSKHPDIATQFANYFISTEGKNCFVEQGFLPLD